MTQLTIPLIQSGGRKTAIASVKLLPGSGANIFINGKAASSYFQNNAVYLQTISTAFESLKTEIKYDAFIKVEGGGLNAQSQAIRLALCKALLPLFPTLRSQFKRQGFLTRDARIKERKKYGLKKARKASQYSKR